MPDHTDEERIAEALAATTSAQWQEISRAATTVAGGEHHAEVCGGEHIESVVDGEETSVFEMPYLTYGESVESLRTALHEAGLIVPFDWPRWDGVGRYRDGADFREAPVTDAVKFHHCDHPS